jgi:hypothetical protein
MHTSFKQLCLQLTVFVLLVKLCPRQEPTLKADPSKDAALWCAQILELDLLQGLPGQNTLAYLFRANLRTKEKFFLPKIDTVRLQNR